MMMRMRKTGAMLGLTALLLALLVGQPGSGQMQNPMQMQMGMSSSPQMNPRMLEQEIELLIAINRMGLSVEQLAQLQGILAELKAPQIAHRQHRQELRDFLLSWQGTPEEFEQALQSFQEERKQQLQQLKAQREERIAQLKDVLTYRQGELLRQALHKLSAPKRMEMGGMGMMGGMAQPQPMGRQEGPAHGAALGQQPPMGMGRGHGQGQAQAPAQPGMGMMGMMQQHMQMMHQMMQRMGQGSMEMGMMGMMGADRAQAPKLEELIEKHAELLERVIRQKLQALQGQ